MSAVASAAGGKVLEESPRATKSQEELGKFRTGNKMHSGAQKDGGVVHGESQVSPYFADIAFLWCRAHRNRFDGYAVLPRDLEQIVAGSDFVTPARHGRQ